MMQNQNSFHKQNSINKKDSYIALLILLLLVISVWYIIIDPIWSLKSSYHEQLTTKIKMYNKLASRDIDISHLKFSLKKLRTEYKAHEAFFQNVSVQKAENRLLQIVREVFKSHNFSIQQTQFIKSRDLENSSIIGMNFNALINAEQLVPLFNMLEKSKPVLIFKKVKISRSSFQNKDMKLKLDMKIEAILSKPVQVQ